jgi:RNA-binding protein 25
MIKPWLYIKSEEVLGTQENTLIDIVMDLFQKESSSKVFRKSLEKIFLEETDNFVFKLWRVVLFEQYKLKYKDTLS